MVDSSYKGAKASPIDVVKSDADTGRLKVMSPLVACRDGLISKS